MSGLNLRGGLRVSQVIRILSTMEKMMPRLMLCALLLSVAPLAATAQQKEREGLFPGMKLISFLEYVARKTKVNILHDRTLGNRTVHLLSPGKIDDARLLDTCRLVLSHAGYALLKTSGDKWTYVVVESGSVKWSAHLELIENARDLPRTMVPVTFVRKLRHASAREVYQALRIARLADPRAGIVVGLEDAGALLISDYAPNIRRMLKAIDLIDVPTRLQSRSIRVEVVLLPTQALAKAPRLPATGEATNRLRRLIEAARAQQALNAVFSLFMVQHKSLSKNTPTMRQTVRSKGQWVELSHHQTPGGTLGLRLKLQFKAVHLGTSLELPLTGPGVYAAGTRFTDGKREMTVVVIVEVR